MKQIFVLLLLLLLLVFLFTACKDNRYGNLKQQLRLTTNQQKQSVKSEKINKELNYYTQFGDFITTITPTSFIGEFDWFCYNYLNANDDYMSLIDLSNNNGFSADFSNNSTVSIIPILGGSVYENADGEGGYFKHDVTFKKLVIQMNLKQVIELPSQYSNIHLTQFDMHGGGFAQQNGNILTTEIFPLNQIVEELKVFYPSIWIVFGGTDSTYIDSCQIIEGLSMPPTYQIKSSKFNEWTLTPPLPDQTKTVVSTLGFNNDNIIHVYAGSDNIPYTTDDVIVLEPKFWERIYSNVNINVN